MQAAKRLNDELIEDVRRTLEAGRDRRRAVGSGGSVSGGAEPIAIRTAGSSGSLRSEGTSPPLRTASGRLVPVSSIEAHPLWERQRRQNAELATSAAGSPRDARGVEGAPGGQPPRADAGGSAPAVVLDAGTLLGSTLAALESPSEAIKLAALLWLPLLLRQVPALGSDAAESDAPASPARASLPPRARLPALLRVLCDSLGASSAAVAEQALSVLSELARRPEHARAVLLGIVDAFRGAAGAKLLQRRGVLIVQTLADRLGALRVLASLSELAASDADAGGFGASLIQALNLLLLANRAMRPVRELVAGARADAHAARVFSSLLRSWAPSGAASLSLALLAGADDLACGMLGVLASPLVALRVDTMVEACQLVSLLDSPAFAALRLRLLDPEDHPALRRALRSLLMLLPQGDAFRTLSTRMAALPREESRYDGRATKASKDDAAKQNSSNLIDEAALLAEFRRVQEGLALKEESAAAPLSPASGGRVAKIVAF